MKRSPIKRSGIPMKRTALRRVSKHRADINRQRRAAQEAAWGPHQWWRCVFRDHPAWIAIAGECHGEVWGHEILSRARAGRTDENLLDVSGQLPCCNYHNSWVDLNDEQANAWGLSTHAWEGGADEPQPQRG